MLVVGTDTMKERGEEKEGDTRGGKRGSRSVALSEGLRAEISTSLFPTREQARSR